MTVASGEPAEAGDEADVVPGFDLRAARHGLALLQMQARAADPKSQPGWVHRRVQQLEFLDSRAVRWRVSVDFVVPQDAPMVEMGDKPFRLVPITSLAKSDLVAFSLRDELGAAVWMPTSGETTTCLASALVYWAAHDLGLSVGDVPLGLVDDIWRIVQERPGPLAAHVPGLLLAAALIDAHGRDVAAGRALAELEEDLADVPWWRAGRRLSARGQVVRARRLAGMAARALSSAEEAFSDVAAEVRPLAERLMASANFRSQVEELAQNFIVHVGANSPPGSRRIIKLAYESEIRFARPGGRSHRLWQSLGWRCWQMDVRIGGRGGSHHLEVAAPPGIDVVGITADRVEVSADGGAGVVGARAGGGARARGGARAGGGGGAWHGGAVVRWVRRWWHQLIFWQPAAALSVSGYAPHVHINPPGGSLFRYRCAIFVRVSRPGWLTASWLVAVAIGIVTVIGRFSLPALFSKSETGEAGTAATLLLALLGVFATMLVRPGEHPLAARLLVVARTLILTEVVVVLIGVGNLVLHQTAHGLPVTLWTWLAVVAGAATLLFTISWLLPVAVRPHREL